MLSRYRVNCVSLIILIFGQLCWPFYRGIRSTVETLLSRYPVNSGDLDPEQLLDPFSHLAEEQLGNHTHQFLVNTLIIIDVMIIAGKQEYRHGNWKPKMYINLLFPIDIYKLILDLRFSSDSSSMLDEWMKQGFWDILSVVVELMNVCGIAGRPDEAGSNTITGQDRKIGQELLYKIILIYWN